MNHQRLFLSPPTDKIEPFVNITSTELITAKEGEAVSWHAEVIAFPPDLTIIYTDWRGHQLHQEKGRVGISVEGDVRVLFVSFTVHHHGLGISQTNIRF